MCESFRSTFERNQAKYSEAVFESLAKYFETPDTMKKLGFMLEKYFGMYIRSPKFGDHAGRVIDDAFKDVIRRALKKNFKKGENLKGLYTELDKYGEVEQKETLSKNPMDPNWGGNAYTNEAVKKGIYKGNEVNIAVG
jgi:hypothetical protein